MSWPSRHARRRGDRGGAHPTRPYRIHERFFAYIPFRQSINPITKTNWEGVGVKPDVAISSADALKFAHDAALKELGHAAPVSSAPVRNGPADVPAPTASPKS